MTAADEQALATGLALGDRSSVARFFERTHHPVYCMAARLTRDPELRRDWTHDVLMGVLEDVQRGRFVWRRPGSFWAWFGRRAWFRLLDCHRRHRRRSAREQPLDDERRSAPDSGLGSAPEPTFDPPIPAQLELVEMTASVESCLEQLPNELHRRALRLLLFDDLPYDAIAEQLDAPLNTVRAWIRRGRMQLRVCVARALGIEIRGEEDA
jgi:RNA polymerase sigma-70 factor (ECF subfamily)